MCLMCRNPEMTQADYDASMREIVDETGWAIQLVERDRRHAAFAYTIGLEEIGHPELLVTGLPQRAAGELLNTVAHGVAHHGERPVPGERRRVKDRWLEIVEVDVPSAHLLTAVRLVGPDVRALQLVYTDDRSRWPWHVGFRGRQPVLGSPVELGR